MSSLGRAHHGSPDYQDYHALKDRGLSRKRACMTIARKLARRSFHLLRAFGPDALAEPVTPRAKAPTITVLSGKLSC
ncbi:MAG TPA: hypothetical protein VHV75_06770 [Solirubrobacteraceae bacterium]|jgi:hypothetical protein|nr:hypothetical protein [Solirubrobacteraceae bacterium]